MGAMVFALKAGGFIKEECRERVHREGRTGFAIEEHNFGM